MSKIEEIEKEVQGLKPNELQAFRKWFWDFDAEAWDRQFEKDALTGKLDSLAEAALKSFKGLRQNNYSNLNWNQVCL